MSWVAARLPCGMVYLELKVVPVLILRAISNQCFFHQFTQVCEAERLNVYQEYTYMVLQGSARVMITLAGVQSTGTWYRVQVAGR